jgi:hypothetical protein
MKKIRVLARTIWTQLQTRRTLLFLGWSLSATLILAAWLFQPLYQDPLVRVSGSMFSVSVSCIPSMVSLETRTGYLQVERARLVLLDRKEKLAVSSMDMQPTSTSSKSSRAFQFALTANQQSHASGLLASSDPASSPRLVIEFSRVPAFEIKKLRVQRSDHPDNRKCESEELIGNDLDRAIATPQEHKVVKYLLPQEEIGDFILLINEFMGSVLVCSLLLSILWLLYQCGQGAWRVYCISPEAIRERTSRRQEEMAIHSAFSKADVIKGDYRALRRRLEFVRVLGPALGFLLTVSSLVAGIHPSVQATQDSFLFVSSLQLALVATFVGLLTRVIAEFAVRIHTSASERALLEAGEEKS